MHTPDERRGEDAIFDASTLRVTELVGALDGIATDQTSANQTSYAAERVRAVDAAAQCMADSALGG